jgi:heme iron utilization protein
MNASTPTLDEIAEEARHFRDTCKSLQLATCSASGVPTASYAPYAPSGRDTFYIYVSELAAHTPNLRSARPVSALLIEDEAQAGHLFARRRLTLSCDSLHLARGTPAFDAALAALAERFGDFMQTLARMTDFHAFELLPRHGSYVRGFAQAYELPGAQFTAIRHLNERGHRNA